MPELGFVDTVHGVQDFSQPDYGSLTAFTNQYAAMPSLHFGWSLWCGVVVVALAPRLWMKLLGLLHPFFTVCAIVGTANHWVLDAVGGRRSWPRASAWSTSWREPGRARRRARRRIPRPRRRPGRRPGHGRELRSWRRKGPGAPNLRRRGRGTGCRARGEGDTQEGSSPFPDMPKGGIPR
ncbi:phosphatase PAP2 family protein [Actinomadura keratinilytica]